MLYQTLRPDINDMISRCFAKLRIPAEKTHWFCTVQVLNRFIDSSRSFFCSQGCLTGLAQRVTIKATKHLLKVWDERSGVASKSIRELEDLAIELLHVRG